MEGSGWWQVKFYPYEKGGGGADKVLKGEGGTKRFGVVFPWKLEVLAILKGGHKIFPH